jgi:hypothetical protein
MSLFSRWLMDPRWRNSRWRRESAGVMLMLGSFFGQAPPHLDPLPTEIATPLERDQPPGPTAGPAKP